MSRTIDDIPARLLACYEWQDATATLPKAGEIVCVSMPFADPPRAIAILDDGKFFLVGTDERLEGVTFWCHAPTTPEDADALTKAIRAVEAREPDFFSATQPGLDA